jgi:hypothetical protein
MALIILGYIVCFIVFTIAAIDQRKSGRKDDALLNALSAVVTFFIGFYSLRYLAST